ncbi:hypothetical protein [Mycolicibacterium vinylchloridicum]|uniref:hypothetical protein n=1 Tax=Mycolicibacterium vinylchloridicum TaxID=2736928 RepID=UPI001C53AEA1|nr:hypothetical protein [Mycolicibacterium vinylchloridicum]
MIIGLLEGFWTWQTPLSFLAGVGVHHIYCKYYRDRTTRKVPVFKKRADGTYRFSTRFWVYTSIATVIICWIGWRTQATANEVERQAKDTKEYSVQNNDCLKQVVEVLTTRVGYNDALDRLDTRREAIWDSLVDNLAVADNSAGLNQAALYQFQQARAALRQDRVDLIKAREENQYPRCTQIQSEARP